MRIEYEDIVNIGPLILTNIDYNIDSQMEFIRFKTNISQGLFHAESIFETELYEIETLIKGLELIYNNKLASLRYENIDHDLIIEFAIRKYGHIGLKIIIQKYEDDGKLEIGSGIDITFLPQLILELREVVKHKREHDINK